MPRFTKKSLALLGAFVLLIVGAGVAYAYWTADGTGTGTAGTGDTESITIVQTSVVSDMMPGDAPQDLSGTFDNPAANGPVYVATVTASITSVTPVGAGTCDSTDYSLVNPVMDVDQTIQPGTAQGTWGDPADVATIQFNNKATNQDGCKGATVAIGYVSN